MKYLILFCMFMFFMSGADAATTIAEDNFNRADSTDLGPKWYEEYDYYNISNNQLFFRMTSTTYAVINQNVSLSQGDYNLTLTYIDRNENDEDAKFHIMFYIQSYTSDTDGLMIELREDSAHAYAYWPNATYIEAKNMGITLNNNTVYSFLIVGDNVSIYQNGTYRGFLESWSNLLSNGTVGFRGSSSHAGIAIDDFSVSIADVAAGTPDITSYAPLGTIWPEVADNQRFNVTVNQSTQCRWYINGSLAHTNSTPSLTHSYTNTSLNGGGCNVTAVVNNTNGTDIQTWLFEVGADSVSYIILQDDPTNQSMIFEVNITRIGSNVTDWGWWQNHTFSEWQYFFRFTNGTEIMNQTATSNNESLWFNGTSLLPIGVYFINATGAATTYTPPTPTTLANTTGSTWVNHTWSPGSGNVTDSYNVNVNSVWHNGTTDTHYKDTYLPGAWQNITVFAYNSSGAGTLSAASISQNTQVSSVSIEDFVNPPFVSAGAAAILFVAAAGRFAISAWRNRRRKRRN
jgi:hypothetical protein